jgi:hypothetical protein
MALIIASGHSDEDSPKCIYLVKGEGYSRDENTWKTYENVLECSSDLLKEY